MNVVTVFFLSQQSLNVKKQNYFFTRHREKNNNKHTSKTLFVSSTKCVFC